MTRRSGPSTAVKLKAAEREERALRLRTGGVSYEDIGNALGYANASGAWRAVSRALKRIPEEAAAEMRRVEAERFDAMLVPLWNRALRGDTTAVDAVLKISAARAKMFGINIEAEALPPLIIAKAYLGIDLERL